MLQLKHIEKTFNPGTVNEKRALTDLNLDLKDGDFATIVGSNGAGKSTMFNAITGAFYVDEGQIILDGEDITYKKEYLRSHEIGHLFQDPLRGTAPGMTIEENMALAYLRAKTMRNQYFSRINKADKEKFREQLALLDMGLEDRMKQPVGLLSGGQRQAVAIARAVYQNGDIMIFDEPTSAMGMKETERIMNLFRALKEQGKTIILISHNLFQVFDISDRICVIKNGRQIDSFLTRDSSPEQLYQTIIEKEDQTDGEKMDE